ncbi:MAG: hypothetical protein QG657_2612 [Acidobacteriota bacterium]|nr:hypothetical protein [Acidobacteriota bacterium]
MGEHFPQVVQFIIIVGERFPMVGDIFPNVGELFPYVGGTSPHVVGNFFKVGEFFPGLY